MRSIALYSVVALLGMTPFLRAEGVQAGAMQGGCGHGQAGGHENHGDSRERHAVQEEPAPVGDPYLVTVDPVSGEPLPDKPIVVKIEGREFRFSSQETLRRFKANPEEYLPRLDQQIVEQQLEVYPQKTCIVSGEDLDGEMGPAVDHVYGNRLVRFCCTACISRFEKDAARYLSALDQAAIQVQKKTYQTTFCIVSGEKLNAMGEPQDLVIGNRLVRLCCRNCEKTLRASPVKYLSMISKG